MRTKERGKRDAAHHVCNASRVPIRGSPGRALVEVARREAAELAVVEVRVALLLDDAGPLKKVLECEAQLSCRVCTLGLERGDKEGAIEGAADEELGVEVCARWDVARVV